MEKKSRILGRWISDYPATITLPSPPLMITTPFFQCLRNTGPRRKVEVLWSEGYTHIILLYDAAIRFKLKKKTNCQVRIRGKKRKITSIISRQFEYGSKPYVFVFVFISFFFFYRIRVNDNLTVIEKRPSFEKIRRGKHHGLYQLVVGRKRIYDKLDSLLRS